MHHSGGLPGGLAQRFSKLPVRGLQLLVQKSRGRCISTPPKLLLLCLATNLLGNNFKHLTKGERQSSS